MSEVKAIEKLPFEKIKQIDDNGVEFWYARDLQVVLEYVQWRNFHTALKRAVIACEQSGNSVSDHFAEVSKMVGLGSGAMKKSQDYKLTRYACYLIVQNGDPRKDVIALGQTYFAVQTRKMEKVQFDLLDENNRRIFMRNQASYSNKLLAEAAYNANVKTVQQFAIFQNHGYRGLYGGESVADIHKRKGLKKNEQILDFMGSTELSANLFRITQTEARLLSSNISTPQEANEIHYKVGNKVRNLMVDVSNILPENLPKPEKSIKVIEQEEFEKLKKLELGKVINE